MNDETAVMDPETDFDEPTAEDLAALAEEVEEQPAEPEAEDVQPEVDPEDEDGDGQPSGSTEPDIVIEGTTGQLSLTGVGGKKPTSSSVRLVGGSIGLEGQFAKGEVISLLVEARVGEVAFIDTVDESGVVTATERRHKARIVGAVRD